MGNRPAVRGDLGLDDVLKAVRQKCLDCCYGSRNAVEECRIKSCALLPYRCLSAMQNAKQEPKQAEIITLFDDLPETAKRSTSAGGKK